MRIAPPGGYIKAYVPPVPAVPLSAEASRTLIASGVFQHSPNHVLWTAPGQAAAHVGAPLPSAASTGLAAGVSFQPRLIAKPDDSLLTTLLDIGRQSIPVLENSGLDTMADGAALLVATPDILKALTGPDCGNGEKVFLCAASLVKVLNIVNKFAHIPHADAPLEVVATIFQVGEQVYIAASKKSAAG